MNGTGDIVEQFEIHRKEAKSAVNTNAIRP